ncbi:MAG: outer membrane beta-barrel protein [Sideroxydans sp.]|nr:outer membrane beta-barrel protein [Sideroxydans sp.]
MKFKQRMMVWSIGSTFAVLSGGAFASGFALVENGASGLGNAYAGGAAIAEDASTIFFNPAGMTNLPHSQLVAAAHAIKPSLKFSNTTSALPAPRPLGSNGGDGGSWALVPNVFFATEISPSWRVGLGLNAPFALQTEYTPDWIGRFQAIKSKIETINFNPSVAYQASDTVSLGAGLDYQRIRGELTSAVNLVVAEGASSVTGSDAAWGYNLGALIKLSPQTRIGFAYRSRVKYNMNGSVIFTGGVPSANGPITLAITMPDSYSASVFHQLDDKWDIMADATRTGWSVMKQLNVLRTTGTPILQVPENWRDTWRVSAGASYHYNTQWMARLGLAYDQTPVSDTYRTARIPDASRYQIAVGGQYKPSPDNALDFGYTHLFAANNVSISDLQGATAATASKGNLVGSYKVSVDIFSLQYTQNF